MSQPKRQISKNEAVEKLWRNGILHWKLDSCQKQLYRTFHDSKYRKVVWKCSRRLGKSFALLVVALEYALKNPGTQIKYACPTAIMAQKIIIPTIRKILEDCPVDIKPNFVKAEKCFYFQNDSIMQIEGVDEGNAEKLRGTESHLSILDEAGFMDDLEYVINDILLPQCLTTNGKILMSSTPSKEPNHPFDKFALEAELNNAYIKKTILDALEDIKNDPDHFKKRLNPQIIDEIMISQGGANSTSWRREFLCVDEDTLVKTSEGYRPIKDIEKGDLVFTHLGTYEPVQDIYMNPVDGRQMYNVSSSNREGFIVTEGHKFFTSFKKNRNNTDFTGKWEQVQDLVSGSYKGHYHKIPIDKTLIESNINKDLAYLAGWHIAEGHVSKSTQQQVLSLGIQDPFTEIDDLTYKIWGKRYKVYSTVGKCFQAHLLSKKAKAFYSQFGEGATNKRITKEFKYANEECKIALLKGLFLGDGWFKPSKKNAGLASSSISLIADVSDMLHSLGILHSIHVIREAGPGNILGREINLSKGYSLSIYRNSFSKFSTLIMGQDCDFKPRCSHNFIDSEFAYYRIKSITKISYKKKYVYDINVKNAHSYVGLLGTFHNCENIIDMEKTVLPEFTDIIEKAVVKEWPRPKMFDGYTAMDLGFVDFTGILFAYYDFVNNKIVIEDEALMSGREVTTKNIADTCKMMESKYWIDPMTGFAKPSYLRVSDDDLITINDLYRLHSMQFIPTKKDDKETAVNEVRMKLQAEQIIINPRCKNLIYQIKTATWAKNRKTFERTEQGGHFDLVDALIYLVRNIQYYKNPYPQASDATPFGMHTKGIKTLTDTAQAIKSLFSVKTNK